MSDESIRYQVKRDHYDGLSDEDRLLKIEARVTNVLSQYGGKRLVAGKVLHDLIKDVTAEILSMKADGLV